MSSGYSSQSYLLASATQSVAENATNQVVSKVFRIPADGRLEFRADLTAANTAGGSPTAMLQTSHDGETWVDGKTTTVADGNVAINYLPNVAGDQAYLPLCPLGRIAITTGAGVSVDITEVFVAEPR